MMEKQFSDYPPVNPDLNVVAVGKSEADRAAEFKGRAQKLMIELCALMDESFREGLLIRWAGVGLNPQTGRHETSDLHIEKRF